MKQSPLDVRFIMLGTLRWLRRIARSEIVAGIGAGLAIGIAILLVAQTNGTGIQTNAHAPPPMSAPVASGMGRVADLAGQRASHDVRYIADWIADSRDARGAAFVIVDKKDARVYVFNGEARLIAASPVLLGGAKGDDTLPGTASRPIDELSPEERTTPAGRFVGERGYNARGEDVVWVDYDAAVSMHRVLTTNPRERRLERLATPSSRDNRISYGCINVPVPFFESYIRPTFAKEQAIVYVLPEVKPLDQVFGSYDVAAARRFIHDKAQG